MDVVDNNRIIYRRENNVIVLDSIRVRSATEEDLGPIYEVACSVGHEEKNAHQGFLMDDYTEKPKYYQSFFKKKIANLEHFYVAEENGAVVGFIMAYKKKDWLEENPDWISDIVWSPEFDIDRIDDFIVVDKIAVSAENTSQGIGSMMHNYLLACLNSKGIRDIFQEVIVSPTPNFASLAFKHKQDFSLAGVRYEDHNKQLYTDLIYHKSI
ncbi:GNAT family N-acetyltransferase [Geosporobacter ferrireducens]|uniref:GCN5 family acetyltransferase n=1 Tax=Geosporobacter ferrireducens TaxID=1424294 RepID=A0A1D8GDP1_9FIRM|nr:GNAT family N-acetyltransferase [Geosporobacter ferrireducens]AOT69029.1 GCN5 family acetyltransferase [Geosporobacter ferrireducens]MTI56697.1 GNAT family N-acetyltransferase [Geosporobacter ferrireducens]